MKYTIDELTAAKRQIDSTLHKLRETVLIFGQPGFHNAAAVGRVVFLSHGVTSFLARKGA